MDRSVSPAGRADRAALLRLLGAQLEGLGVAVADEDLAAAVDGVLADPSRGAFLLAREGEAPVGVAYLSYQWSLEHGGRAAWLEELYVVPDRRASGAGTRLLRAAIDLARAAGCAAVDLEVEASHARAESLYLREGFRRHARNRWVRRLRARPE